MFMRKLALAFVAAVALGLAAMPSAASAQSHHGGRGWHGGGSHGGWHGGSGHWHGGWRYGRGWGYRGWRGGGWSYPYLYVPAPYYGDCYRPVRVRTPWGPRWRRVWICG